MNVLRNWSYLNKSLGWWFSPICQGWKSCWRRANRCLANGALTHCDKTTSTRKEMGRDPRMKVDTRFWGWPQQHSTSSLPLVSMGCFFYIRNVLLLYSLSVDISPPLSLSLYLYICIININASTCWSPPFFAWAGRFFFGRQSVDDSSGNGVWKSHYGSVRAARGFDSRIIMRHSLFRAKRTDSDIIASYRDHKVSAGRDAAQSPTAFNFIISSPHPRGRLLHPTTDDTEK